MEPYTITVRAGDAREETVALEAESRDAALYAAGLFVGKNYSGRWALVKIEAGWGVPW